MKLICKQCKQEFEGDHSDRCFCCCRCAAIYTNHQRKLNGTNKHTDTDKAKISASVKLYYHKHPEKLKVHRCKVCGSLKESCKHPEICHQFLIRKGSINLKKLGFNFDALGTQEIYSEYYKLQNYLSDEYLVRMKSLREICDEHNMTCETSLVKIMDMFGIERRCNSVAIVNAIINGRMDLTNFHGERYYHHGWHTAWNGTNVYYRSSYELDLCKDLDRQKVLYIMEALRIPYTDTMTRKIRVSIPDFYLPTDNLIIEVKSDRTYNQQNMIDRFRAYKAKGYNYKLILEHIDYGKRLPSTRSAFNA